MSYYRIWRYPLKEKACKHIYFRRDRAFGRAAPKEITDDAFLSNLVEAGRADSNLCRARSTVRNLILCNKFDFFCTFTFNAQKVDRYNFPECKKKLSKVFHNYKVRYAPDFRYLVIPEFHKDGAVHFHGMVRGIRPNDLTVPDMIYRRDKKTDALERVPNTKKYVDWAYYSQKLGFFSCSAVRDYEACAHYVTKYITKDLADLPGNMNMFLSSKNLTRPELIFDCDDVPLLFEADYEDEYVRMSFQPDSATFGSYVPEWYGECCAELHDPLEEPPEPLFPRMTGKQLGLWKNYGDYWRNYV